MKSDGTIDMIAVTIGATIAAMKAKIIDATATGIVTAMGAVTAIGTAITMVFPSNFARLR